ncbi:Poly [ADP-ribose] polymerase 1 [Zostera marina]|uniref:Poly [ADP-ribose] polymerase n=1 Tax=Zostera marina TaxID=29655 RepID=A0A0K9P8D4_ZOSMR|nr:Poly [ADP-ribose] polymerase 1 [Zostera marina]
MASPKPEKPWKAEYAKSSRSSCKSCKSPISKDVLRFGKMVVATQFDGFMPMWNHSACIFKKANQIKSIDDVEGADLLRWEDQQKIKDYVESGSMGTKDGSLSTKVSDGECGIEISKSSRSTCRKCNEKIMKGMVRVSLKPHGQGAKGLAWHHVKCFFDMSPSAVLEKLSGWEILPTQDKEEVCSTVKNISALNKKESEAQENKADSLDKKNLKATKRSNVSVEHESKTPKIGENTSAGGISRKGTASSSSAIDLEKMLEEQTKILWAIKDELKKNVTVRELREMLDVNGQDSGGSEYDLRERCADGMVFGALDKCSLCMGFLSYSGRLYRCHGYLSAWGKCNFTTTEPIRLKSKWKIPKESKNKYFCEWFKSQNSKKPVRILPLPTSSSPLNQSVGRFSQPFANEGLENLKVTISGVPKEKLGDLKSKLESVGVAVHAKIKKDTSCLVVGKHLEEADPEIKRARKMKLPIVMEDYLADCITRKKILAFDLYKVEKVGEVSDSAMVTVKVKGRSSVHESSGLQDTCHILEDGKSIYNTTLNMSDLSTGVNSYYVLQVIEEDKGSDCYVFRKWGRVGNNRIGGSKLNEMTKSDAIVEFRRLFLEKTGNSWEAWEQRLNFEKQPGRFFPLDIDYGIKQTPMKDWSNEKSLLHPQLVDLMKILFNIETYRAAMMEFEINMSEMPLGKLSKNNIQQGFEALTDIQNLLNDVKGYSAAEKESLIINASNRFFTLIPSIHPHVIRDENDFNLKVKMLEALQDIEVASKLVDFNCENDESLDEKYKKLNCDIVPISHNTEDYKLVKHYLQTTHAPTHKDWTLELEDVFALERKGEFDKYAAYRNKLQNKMLLWHGSRLTNFVGILSQGLRIAPPEAPASGYMFGKGVYFADLVSKSAQYCSVNKKDPVGFLLLSEVALGDMYELKKATYVTKPPKGKHSTKGLGKTVPLESEYVQWKDVVVPCGKPVSCNIRGSELLYNEYIVYDTAQVKMQFLLKVRFHHKR